MNANSLHGTGSYSVTVETRFSALHRLRLPDGSWEPPHGHDWFVRATFARDHLDDHGMVVDFHEAARALEAVVAPLHHADLNQYPPFEGKNPTAEVLARWVFDGLVSRGMANVSSVSVVEAPGCVATYAEAGLEH